MSISKQFMNYTLANALPGLLALVTIPILTHLFSPDEYGFYTLMLGGVRLMTTLLYVWMGRTILRFYDQYKQQRTEDRFLAGFLSIWLRITGGMTALAVIPIGLAFYGSGANLAAILLLSLLYVIEQSLIAVGFQLLRLHHDSRRFALAKVLSPTATIFFVIGFTYFLELGLLGLFLAICLADALVILMIYASLAIPLKPERPEAGEMKEYLAYGIPLVLVGFSNWVINLSDRFMLAAFHDTETVGVYAIAYALPWRTIGMLFMSIMLAAYPIILSVWNKSGRVETELALKKFLSLFFIILIPACAGMILLADNILILLADPAYHSGTRVMQWIVLAMFFSGFSMYINKTWELLKLTQTLLYITAGVAVLNVVLNLFIIPTYGSEGAAFTTMISFLSYCLISMFMSRKLFTLKIDVGVLLKVLISSSVMAVALKYLQAQMGTGTQASLLLILVGVAVYGILGFGLGLHKSFKIHLDI